MTVTAPALSTSSWNLASADSGVRSRVAARRVDGLVEGLPVAAEQLRGDREVARELHMDQLGREVEQQGGVQLAALDRRPGALQQGPEVEAEHVDHLHSGIVGPDRAERLEVGVAGLGREDD